MNHRSQTMDAIDDGYSNLCDLHEGKSKKKMTPSKSKMYRKVEAVVDLCELGARLLDIAVLLQDHIHTCSPSSTSSKREKENSFSTLHKTVTLTPTFLDFVSFFFRNKRTSH